MLLKPRMRWAILCLFIQMISAGCSEQKRFSGRTLRIGYDDSPPYAMIAPDGSPKGLAVELITEAAHRSRIPLQWVKVDRAFYRDEANEKQPEDLLAHNRVDLWPIAGRAQERLARFHIGRPWLQNNFYLVSKADSPIGTPQDAINKRVLHLDRPLANEMYRKFLRGSRPVIVKSYKNLLRQLCAGDGDAVFLETRTLESMLLDRSEECAKFSLSASPVSDAVSFAGIESRREFAAETDALSNEILSMAADGTFERYIDRWSSFSATQTRSLIALQQAYKRDAWFSRERWILLLACVALAGIAIQAKRSRLLSERSRAIEASRSEVLRELAQGAPLDKIVLLLSRILDQCSSSMRGTVVFGDPVNPELENCAAAVPILDFQGRRIGTLSAQKPLEKLTRAERDAIEGVCQLAGVIAENRSLHSKLKTQAKQDRLTGTASRSVFIKALKKLTDNPDNSAALFFFDLDRFKQVNDCYGHAVGDLYLRHAAERIKRCFRGADMLARIGGDDFALLAPGMEPSDYEGACQRVIHAFAAPFSINGNRISGGISIGVSTFPEDGRISADLQCSAEAALYKAKRRGGNSAIICSPEIREYAAAAIRTEALIRQALDQKWFELFYQPQVSKNGDLQCLEALVRIRHPEQGLIPAALFMEVAERAGLVTEIDAWVIPEAARQYAEWHWQGLAPVRIAINISRLDLSHASIFDLVISSLDMFGLGPDALQVELTETSAVLGGESSLGVLRQFRAANISLALDDFGCGYSSLSCLHDLPFDTLKIDKSFVKRLSASDGSSRSLVAAIISAAKSFDMAVIAEGVETAEQAASLNAMHCDLLQGYYISRPIEAKAAAQLLADRAQLRIPAVEEFDLTLV